MSVEIKDDVNESILEHSSNEFSWENRITQSWEKIAEDDGALIPSLATTLKRGTPYLKKRLLANQTSVKRGIIRNVVFILDFSSANDTSELKPNRAQWTLLNLIKPFSLAFLEQNPLGLLSIILVRNGLAEKLCDLSSSSSYIDDCIQKFIKSESGSKGPSGEFSLLNGLALANGLLSSTSSLGVREVISIQSSLASSDSIEVEESIEKLRSSKTRFHCISLWGESYLPKSICRSTGGRFLVPYDEVHVKELLETFLSPPIFLTEDGRMKSFLVPMGFPDLEDGDNIVRCLCHQRCDETGTFQCPRCHATACRLPTDCQVCSLMLISSFQLAKSYHHLFPPAELLKYKDQGMCKICESIGQSAVVEEKCSRCCIPVCIDCSNFIQDSLFQCPGCLCLKEV